MTMFDYETDTNDAKGRQKSVLNVLQVDYHTQTRNTESKFGNHSVPMIIESEDAYDHTIQSHTSSVNFLCEQLVSVGMDERIKGSSVAVHVPHSQNDRAISLNEKEPKQLDAIAVYRQDEDGDTLLHSGIILHKTDYVMMCINMAASYTWLACKNHLFQTPLHLAVLTNQITVVRRLVVGGADVESRDKDGNTALHIACREGLTSIVESIIEPVRFEERSQNQYEIPCQRIPQNLEIRNYEGLVCLHLAAARGYLEIAQILIDRGADINAKEGKTGRTILHNACLDGNLDLVRLLLRYKDCDINARAYDDYTPFDFARALGHTSIIMELAATGARYDDEDDME